MRQWLARQVELFVRHDYCKGLDMTTFTQVTPPANLRAFWQGAVFYQAENDDRYGVLDESRLCRIFGYDYISEIRAIFSGPFTLIEDK